MKLGMREFENTMFMLKAIPREENINRFALQGNLIPERLDNIAWFLPAYLSADFNLFFVFAPNVNKRWAVPTGLGLNAVNELSPSSAIELVAYLKTLEVNGLGYFDEEVGKEENVRFQ